MAQPAEPGDTIPSLKPQIVTSTRTEAPPFEVPASVDVVAGEDMRQGQLQVNLSESLGGVPGLLVQNRQNYAQDLQLSVRGFGARSTFGIRGVRLYVDGIPATMPDGQGQSSNIDIASAGRVEVLRGPFSALYGNSSGGVVQVFSEEGEGPPTISTSVATGSNGLRRYGLKASGATDSGIDYVLSTSGFTTDGWRDHSETSKNLTNARLGIRLSDDSSLTLVLNSVRLSAQDPLGLTAAQLADNPRGAALAQQYNTRKTVDQTQGGLVYERHVDADNSLRLMLYYGTRDTTQFQAIPPAAQASATQAGGVISLGREYGGLDVRWTSRLLLAGRPLTLVGGVNYDTLREQRQGFQNFTGTGAAQQLGVLGALRRDETNRVANLDPYLQATWRMAERWTLEAGLRYSTVRFTSDDHYIVGANGNDSGAANYRKALPMAALRYEANPALNLYATLGRGFETPTFNELSYRSGGLSGLNFALQPSVNTSVEVGAKQRVAGGLLTAALFQTRTDDEIVTDTDSGGRSTFRNAGRTRRNGLELGWNTSLARHWRAQAAYTWLDATYQDGFCATPCTAAGAVAAGNRIPGIARQVAQASLDWAPPTGWRAGVQARYVGAIPVNDLNSESAASATLVALHAGYLLRLQRWEISTFARVDNVFNRRYAGSVIVNESNGRYYESAPGRNWGLGVSAAYHF
ncbi:TonB-dependent receptor [Polaromonas sp. SM01]|uniref:TonB-dependent receptor n=1 Tax=Polaromonas sp. SM01 TaxID=3085630 RepID=UPI0029827BC9|nr:TonB-dependent receptor [Polaromonas sp. SM01]MDW5441609.1 TonB-dependent receptor [Polaromonas sp. SM01]